MQNKDMVESTTDLFVRLFGAGAVRRPVIGAAVDDVLAQLPDLAIDAPKATGFFFSMLAGLIRCGAEPVSILESPAFAELRGPADRNVGKVMAAIVAAPGSLRDARVILALAQVSLLGPVPEALREAWATEHGLAGLFAPLSAEEEAAVAAAAAAGTLGSGTDTGVVSSAVYTEAATPYEDAVSDVEVDAERAMALAARVFAAIHDDEPLKPLLADEEGSDRVFVSPAFSRSFMRLVLARLQDELDQTAGATGEILQSFFSRYSPVLNVLSNYEACQAAWLTALEAWVLEQMRTRTVVSPDLMGYLLQAFYDLECIAEEAIDTWVESAPGSADHKRVVERAAVFLEWLARASSEDEDAAAQ
eukprot:c15446_g1_i1.p1 GENE.c15446_g1_i1~~c15446_g1_i1.p1  ORF type:complete len:361 (+),score=83.02 c15446_g1_i1:2-1084(+)